MIKSKYEASYRVANNIIKAIDELFDMNKSPFEYDDVDTAMRHFLTDYELDYDGFNGNIDDKMDALAEIIITKRIDDDDIIDLASYINGFLETKKILDELYGKLNRRNAEYKDGALSAIDSFNKVINHI